MIYVYDTAHLDSASGRRIVKIGVASDAKDREEQLGEGNPLGAMIAFGPGKQGREKHYHYLYERYRTSREFFALPEDSLSELVRSVGTSEIEAIREAERSQKERNRMLLSSLMSYKERGLLA